jgi:hypothetical protein
MIALIFPRRWSGDVGDGGLRLHTNPNPQPVTSTSSISVHDALTDGTLWTLAGGNAGSPDTML